MRTADDGDDDYGLRRRRGRVRPDPNRFPKVPSEKGIELMNSGNFGVSEIRALSTITQKKKLARRILDRELGLDIGPRRKANQLLMAQVAPLFYYTRWTY
jgi:DDB1- and CUL4-associated factor 11